MAESIGYITEALSLIDGLSLAAMIN